MAGRGGGAGILAGVVVGSGAVRGGNSDSGVGDSGCGCVFGGAVATVIGVRYDYDGIGGRIGPVAVGPPEQPQHNIGRVRAVMTGGRISTGSR